MKEIKSGVERKKKSQKKNEEKKIIKLGLHYR